MAQTVTVDQYFCTECGNEVNSDNLTADEAMACTEHPEAIIDSVPGRSKLADAVREYIARKDRQSHPAGSFDKKKRFVLANSETFDCCRGIRTPSAAYPFSQMVHGRTAEHVANLFQVDVTELRKAVRKAQKNG